MSLFKTDTDSGGHEETISFLRKIANLIKPLSDRPLIVQYEPAPILGEGTPFYHISYSVSILDRRHPFFSIFHLYVKKDEKPVISPMILVFDPHMKTYQMNKHLTDSVKETIRNMIHATDPDISVKEVEFMN